MEYSRMRKQLNNSFGDTIIEVMLALAVLGAIIGGGYSVATRSLNGVRVSQERSEATQIAEGQIEALKATYSGAKNITDIITDDYLGDEEAIFTDPNAAIPLGINVNDPEVFAYYNNTVPGGLIDIGFCYQKLDGKIKRYIAPVDKTDLQDTAYPVECKFGDSDLYHVYIDIDFDVLVDNSSNPLSSLPDVTQLTYNVSVRWDRSGGGEQQNLVLSDRVVLGL